MAMLCLGAAPAEARKYPKIFGSIELFSKKTQRFPKWIDMLGRFKDGTIPCDSSTCTTKGWQTFLADLQGKDLQLHSQYYVPYEQEVPNVLKRAQPLDVLVKRDSEAVRAHLESAGRTEDSVKFLPLRGKLTDGAVLLDASTGAPLDIVLVDPW
jgi:hypothetical protein